MKMRRERRRVVLHGASALIISGLTCQAGAQITPLNSWGSLGTNNGQFNSPQGITVDPSGTVYVVDSFNDRIETFTATGGFISSIGSAGSAAGKFNGPDGISFDRFSNDFAVADTGNARIQVFTPGNPVPSSVFGTSGSSSLQFNTPEGVFANSGIINIADSGNNRIQTYEAGTITSNVNGSGNGLVLSHPDAVVSDQNSGLYIVADSSNDVIQYLGFNGAGFGTFGGLGTATGKFKTPNALAVTSTSRLYVSDELNDRVQVFDANSNFVTSFAVTLPQGLAVTNSGIVYVTSGTNTVQRFFDPAAWVIGANTFTDGTTGPTSLAAGTGQILPAQFTLATSMGLIVGNTLSVLSGGSLALNGGSISTGTLAVGASGAQFSDLAGALTTQEINVSSGGIFSDTSGQNFTASSFIIINDANSQMVLGGGATATTPGFSVNGGLLKVGNATLNANGGPLQAPQVYTAPGAELQLNSGTAAIVDGMEINNSGLLDGTGGQVNALLLNLGAVVAAGSGTSFTFTGSANTSSGSLSITTGGTVHFTHDLTSSGTISMSVGTLQVDGGLTNNNDMEMLANAQVFGTVINGANGLIHSTGVANTFRGAFTNNGTINAQSGALAFLGGYTGPGGAGGGARVTLDQSVSTGPTPATLSFTGTVAVLMQPTMTLHLRLVGATPDKLTIAGTGTLGGTMSIDSYNGLPPLPGQSFQAITFGSEFGDIGIANNTGFSGLRFSKSFTSAALVIAVSAQPGDVTLDGKVNTADFNALAAHFNGSNTNWLSGDLNGDGKTNAQDFDILASNYGAVLPAPSLLTTLVPEPGAAALLILGSAFRIRGRARKNGASRRNALPV